MDASTWIDLVLAKAPALRAAGITDISAQGYSASISSALPIPMGAIDASDVASAPPDALHDPASYPNGQVPGFEIQPFSELEE